MLTAALRDLQWRKRRFVIAIVGTGLVFAMTLVLTGLANGFRVEAQRTVDALGLDSYLIKSGRAGPFIGSSPFPPTELQKAARLPGVTVAVPMVYGSTTIPERGTSRNVNVFGAPERGTRDARGICGPHAGQSGRDLGVEHIGPRHRRRTSKSVRGHCESSASSTTPPCLHGRPTCS